LRELERAALRERAAAHQGSRAELAAVLGISERSLYRKLKALGL
jgi:DNA-binding NtrC family response regulator